MKQSFSIICINKVEDPFCQIGTKQWVANGHQKKIDENCVSFISCSTLRKQALKVAGLQNAVTKFDLLLCAYFRIYM